MMLQNFISIILYVAFVIYAMFGAYSLALNKEARLNRVFAFLCLCFSLWAFAFALANSAGSYDEAFFWRRLSVFGWGVAYSVILHFIIVLTESSWSQENKKSLLILTLYLPAALIVFIFGLYGPSAATQIQLVHSVAGWTTITVNNILDLLFYIYYLSFSLASCVLLIRWYRKTTLRVNKIKAMSILISFSASLILGSFTDVIANRFLPFKLPSLAPVVIMISVATIFYIIRKYEFMISKGTDSDVPEGVILGTDSRTVFFKYLGVVLTAVSMFNFLIRLVYGDQRVTGIFLSLILVLSGVFIILIPYFFKSVKFQENILAVLMTILLPVVMLAYFNSGYSNAIWPLPLFFIMVTVIFNNKRMFYGIVFLSLLMGLVFWLRSPEFLVQDGARIYSLRLLFYGIGISLTALISKIYVSRLEENGRQQEFQTMISEISSDFLTMNRADFDKKVTLLLKKSGCYTKADHAYIAMFSDEFQNVYYTHEWRAAKMEAVIGEADNDSLSARDFNIKQLCEHGIVYLPAAKKLPRGGEDERKRLLTKNVQSRILVPIFSKDRLIGLIGFDQFKGKKSRRIDDPESLKVLANVLADAIAKVETENKMNHLAYYDSLTNLPNRVLFNNRLERAIELAKRSQKYLGVIFIDIDGFKAVKDTFGHDRGDYLLNEMGKRLSACMRKYDTVARFGEDEFLIMLPQLIKKQDLEEIAKMIMSVFRPSVIMGDQTFYMTGSAGIAIFPDDGETVNELIKNADLAMYEARKNGKNQYGFCSQEMKNGVLNKITLTNNLYRALEKNELSLHYQPQMGIINEEIIGFEALLRWEHPERGSISPGVFIPIAEQTGLINSIGEWVLMTACAQNKAWQEMGFKPVQMAVNLSLEQFRKGNLESLVKSSLERTGLEPRYLELEITESITMKESRFVANCLHGLKAIGVGISIDDFGTEFSSLSRLKDLPVDRLKIDMQFIRGIGVNDQDEAIIGVMIHLGKRLGLRVIAEGVETPAQLRFLKDKGCDEIQGYYYHQPLSREAIEATIYKI